MSAQLTFQGLTAVTRQYGTFPWFAPILGWLDDTQDRRDVLTLHKAAGDGLVNLALSSQYNKGAYAGMTGKDFSRDLGTLHDRITEALDFGMTGVALMLAGDGHGDGVHYNDPVGWTYGYEWLMANFERVHDALGDLDPWLVYFPGYDGVVPDWATKPTYTYPDEVDTWLLHARRIGGAGITLGLELAYGYGHWGGEGGNYTSEAGLCLDVVAQEFPIAIGPPDPLPKPWHQMTDAERNPWSQVWSMLSHLQRPYFMPQEQIDAGFDVNAPYYLAQATVRGPRRYWVFEYDTYLWGQKAIGPEVVTKHRGALREMCGPTGVIG
jgi:hypothetical protein